MARRRRGSKPCCVVSFRLTREASVAEGRDATKHVKRKKDRIARIIVNREEMTEADAKKNQCMLENGVRDLILVEQHA